MSYQQKEMDAGHGLRKTPVSGGSNRRLQTQYSIVDTTVYIQLFIYVVQHLEKKRTRERKRL